MTTTHWLGHLAVVSLTGLTVGACALLRAGSPPESVSLKVPEPPPHVVTTVEEDLDKAPEPAQATPPSRPPNPIRQVGPAPRAEPRAGPAVETRPEPVAPARLRSGSAVEGRALAELVRATLDRAVGSLQNIDRSRLSQAAQTQYDTARRFIDQAEAALKNDNPVFARFLADKGATLANQLEAR